MHCGRRSRGKLAADESESHSGWTAAMCPTTQTVRNLALAFKRLLSKVTSYRRSGNSELLYLHLSP